MTSTKFKDYPQEQIDAKLKQVEEFELKFGVKPASKAWRKWCTDSEYRQNEWKFRQATAANIKPNIDYR
jgi:hypothetical protein